MLRIARRRDLRFKRGRNAERIVAGCVDCAAAKACEWMEPYEEVVQQIARLPEHERIVVVLRFWADLTVDAIADRLGVPSGTVKSRLHHSLNRLRSTLEDPR